MSKVSSLIVVLLAVAVCGGEQKTAPGCKGVPHGTFVRSPTSCSHYLYCSEEMVGFEGACSKGLAFNAAKQVCASLKEVDCSLGADISAEQEKNDGEVVENGEEVVENDGEVVENDEEDEWEIVAVPENKKEKPFCLDIPDNTYIPKPNSCNSYYHCANGKVNLESKCPEGFAFNFKEQLCDHEDAVKCAICPEEGSANFADPDNCNYYYRCVDGVRTHEHCAENLRFDRESGSCYHRNSVECSTAAICFKNNATEPVMVADYNDCSK